MSRNRNTYFEDEKSPLFFLSNSDKKNRGDFSYFEDEKSPLFFLSEFDKNVDEIPDEEAFSHIDL